MTREEILLKAKETNSVEELITLANENGMEMTEESAAAYYEAMHKSGELADEELNDVAGGWCYKGVRPVITRGEQHDCFVCSICGKDNNDAVSDIYGRIHPCYERNVINNCGNCKYCIYEKGLWLCDNPDNKK